MLRKIRVFHPNSDFHKVTLKWKIGNAFFQYMT